MSGGGGNAGEVGYPHYLEEIHNDWLNSKGTSTQSTDVDTLLNTAWGINPYTGAVAWDPSGRISVYEDSIVAYHAEVNNIDEATKWTTAINTVANVVDTSILSPAIIDADIASHDAIIDDRIISDILPRFQVGMRDINAVVSSAFIIGKSNIEAFAQRDKNKYAGTARLEHNKQRTMLIESQTTQLVDFYLSKLDFLRITNHYLMDRAKLSDALFTDELNQQNEYDTHEALWDLQVFQHGGSILSAIGGSGGMVSEPGISSSQRKAGGTFMGAGAGAMIGGKVAGWKGAIVGGVIGGIGGYFANK